MLSEREFELYDKFEKGDYVLDDERQDIEDLTSVGLARVGFSFKNGEPQETAELTPLGKNILQRERVMQNPIRRFIYSMMNSII